MSKGEDRKKIVNALEQGWNTPLEKLDDVTKVLIKCGAMHKSKKMARYYIGKKSKIRKEIRKILTKEERQVLVSMCHIVETNRFYKALDCFYKKE